MVSFPLTLTCISYSLVFSYSSCLTLRQRFYNYRGFYLFLSSQQPNESLADCWVSERMPTEGCIVSRYLPWHNTVGEIGALVSQKVCVAPFLLLGNMEAWYMFQKTRMASIWVYLFFSYPVLLFENFTHTYHVSLSSPIPSPPSLLPPNPLLSSPNFMHSVYKLPESTSRAAWVCGYRPTYERIGNLLLAASPEEIWLPLSPVAINHLS